MPPEPSRWPHDPPSSLLDFFLSSSIVLLDSLGKELHLLAASFGGCRHVEGAIQIDQHEASETRAIEVQPYSANIRRVLS